MNKLIIAFAAAVALSACSEEEAVVLEPTPTLDPAPVVGPAPVPEVPAAVAETPVAPEAEAAAQ